MSTLNKIAIDEQIVEDIEKTYKELGFEKPNIEIEKELMTYIESLSHIDRHERLQRIEAWIKAQITPTLSEWEMKYSQNSDLLHKASIEIQKLERAKKQDQVNMDNIQSELADKRASKRVIEENIKDFRLNREGRKQIDINYEKMKATVLLIFSFLIAIGTYIYFANTQIDINWSTMDNNTKVGLVKKLIVDKRSVSQYSVYSNTIEDEDENIIPIDKVTSQDLETIRSENIDLAPTPSLWEYASIDFTIIILAFSSFLLILMGKITATVYEKLKMPNWMYYLIYLLAIAVLIGAVVANSSLSEHKSQKSILKNEIVQIDKKIATIKEEGEESTSRSGSWDTTSSNIPKENPKLEKLKQEKEVKEGKIFELNKSSANFKFIMMILFMFAEILIGSMAWIAVAEYVHKKMSLKNSVDGYIDILDDDLKKIEHEIEKFNKEIDEYQNRIGIISSLEHRLTALKSKLHSKDSIKNIAQQYMEKHLSQGVSALQQAESRWVKGNPL
jgi:hypothetical protein